MKNGWNKNNKMEGWYAMCRSLNKPGADIEAVVQKIPLDIVKRGVTPSNFDLLSASCSVCETDDAAFRVADSLFKMGYTYKFGCNSAYDVIARNKRWNLFQYLMDKSGAYRDPHCLHMCIVYLDQRNLDPFLDRGISLDSYYPHLFTFRAVREKARIASIALIGVGKRRRRFLDVFRVISRVVWSDRCDEKWLENK